MTDYKSSTNKEQKVALITGGAVRVGAAISTALSKKFKVAVHYNSSHEEAEKLCEKIGGTAFKMDLSMPGRGEQLVEQVVKKMGRLDILVNNAAVFEPDDSELVSLARMKIINVDAAADCIRTVKKYMQTDGGSIVNISDIAAFRPFSNFKAYSKTKLALKKLTDDQAVSLAKNNIRINSICPGLVMPDSTMDNKTIENLIDKIPLGRVGTADEVALLVSYLVDSSFITGQTIVLDGGRTLVE